MIENTDSKKPASSTRPEGKLGTFAGVFTPSILTILGIILFLRLGFVVGNGGLVQALVVILIANAISVLTSFSLSAIATNFEVRGGGDYYLISRSLGPEYGGAIGIVLFLAQSVSVAFYAIGFAEGVGALVEVGPLGERLIAGAALLPLFALSWLGSDWASRFQFAIMVILAIALGSFAFGAIGSFDGAVLAENWSASGTLSFWVLFALFFPAVTGFTQGVSMSGDLRDPAKSLPLGTFAAVALSLVVYILCAVLMAGAMPGSELIADYGSMGRIAAVPILISAGIFAATLSSALASFLGAPRILQALATDKLFGFLQPFAKGEGESRNPRRAVLLCFAIAAGTVAVGDLNIVAPIVSMFFLISYGLLNYATYYEASTASPSFRPSFRWYHPRLSLWGCIACAGTMIAIDARAGAIAIAVLFAIHQYLERTHGRMRWADASRSARFQRVRSSLLEMGETAEHDRDWRPVTLVFSDDPARRERIIRLASWIEAGSGITTVVRAIEGQGARVRAECREAESALGAELRALEIEAFARVIALSDLQAGFPVLLQSAGLGSIRPNIALFNWFDREDTAEDAPAMRAFGMYLRSALNHGCSVGLLAARSEAIEHLATKSEEPRVLDIWWHGGNASSKLCLLLAYLTSRRAPWEGARLRLLAPRVDGSSDEDLLAGLEAELKAVRIRAEPVLVADNTWATLAAESSGTSLAFVTFRVRPEGFCDADGELLPGSLEGLPPMVLVQAAREIDLEAQPDEGVEAEQARKEDTLKELRVRTESLQQEAEALRAEALAASEKLAVKGSDKPAAEPSPELRAGEKEVERLEAAALSLERKAIKSTLKAETLAAEIDPTSAPVEPSESDAPPAVEKPE